MGLTIAGGRDGSPLDGDAASKIFFVQEVIPEKKEVPGDGIEPPTRGFSVPCSTD